MLTGPDYCPGKGFIIFMVFCQNSLNINKKVAHCANIYVCTGNFYYHDGTCKIKQWCLLDSTAYCVLLCLGFYHIYLVSSDTPFTLLSSDNLASLGGNVRYGIKHKKSFKSSANILFQDF